MRCGPGVRCDRCQDVRRGVVQNANGSYLLSRPHRRIAPMRAELVDYGVNGIVGRRAALFCADN
jgi:hypothetical protein